MAHIHAEHMAAYANDAAETEKPWDRWEFANNGGIGWHSCDGHPGWYPDTLYRKKPEKPKMVVVNGVALVDDRYTENDPPKRGTRYWLETLEMEEMVDDYLWVNDNRDKLWLERGLVHKTRECAIAFAKARLST